MWVDHGRANVDPGLIGGRELRIAVGRHIDVREGRVIERIGEWEWYSGYLIIPVIADVRRARFDTAPVAEYVVMVLRRATLYRVAATRMPALELPECIGDRPGGNACSQRSPEIEMHGEPGSHVSVDHVDVHDSWDQFG